MRVGIVAAVVLLGLAPPARAQTGPAVAGVALGAVAGGLVSMGVVTANARRGVYLYEADPWRWESLPVPVLAATAALVGGGDGDRLWRAAGWGAVGMTGGAVLGALAGRAAWGDSEGTWAGGVMGGAAGLLAGALIGGLTGGDADPVTVSLAAVAVPW
ncbi:MAG: hypothetical protein RH859_05220 [Longimicrobiales bacterium]